ncbi:hypothetical protein BKA66DRAFT_575859 [Pyrenochaeta sp. MPI-SDFR-AT-0127]|nr:hypothetical protein BKA66DRAFT_575859 [Pyrenochaeta sp. MPI-SDFR-AT-0127]
MSNKVNFNQDEILFSSSLPLIYDKIRHLAEELAVLGKIDFASQIIDLLLSQNRTEHGFRQIEALNFAFNHTGDWPSTIPKSARSKKALKELEPPPSGPMNEEKYDELISEKERYQRDPALCLAIAVELCEQSGKTEVEEMQQDKKVVQALEQIAEHFDDYIGALTVHRKIWPLLASGAVAQQLGVDDAELSAIAEDVLETVRTRIENGRQKADHEGKPIKELLEILAENTEKNARPLYKELREDPPESYLHQPATQKDIENLEKRLKMFPMPDDYKEFLLASNGLKAVYDGHNLTAPLRSAKDVAISSLYPADPNPTLKLVEDSDGTSPLQRAYSFEKWPSATRFIEIGVTSEDPEFLLLDPADVKKTVAAYEEALARDDIDDAIKADTTRAIEDLYGSMKAFKELEWVMMKTVDYVPKPVGTFRHWLEETVRASGKPDDGGGYSRPCLAYQCKAKRARRG